MNDLSQSIQDLPLAALVPVVLAVVVGLLLWGAGRRLLRPGFAAAGLLVGGALGWILGENVNLGVPAIVPALVAGVVLAAVAALTYRLAVACALALVLGIGGPLTVIAVNEVQLRPSEDAAANAQQAGDGEADAPDPDDLDAFDRWLNQRAAEHLPDGVPLQPLTSEELARQFGFGEEVSQHVGTVKTWGESAYNALMQVWNDTPEHLRPAVIGAAATGALLGLLVGALVPGLSASVVTAFGGGLLWLTGLRILAERLVADGFMPTSSRAWLVLWIVISLVGLSIQWMFRPKHADKSEH